jgi:hypothetical protein
MVRGDVNVNGIVDTPRTAMCVCDDDDRKSNVEEKVRWAPFPSHGSREHKFLQSDDDTDVFTPVYINIQYIQYIYIYIYIYEYNVCVCV